MKDMLEILNESVVVVNSEAEIRYCNPAFAMQLNLKREEIIGKGIKQFLKVETPIDEEWKNVLVYRNGKVVKGKVRNFFDCFNGEEVCIYIVKVAEIKTDEIDDTDKMERLCIKQILSIESKMVSKLHRLLVVLADIVIVVNQHGIIISAEQINGGAFHKLGWTTKEMVGKTIFNYTCPEDRKFIPTNEQIRSMDKISYSVRVAAKSGAFLRYEWCIRYIGNSDYYICIGKDINDEKTAEIEKRAYMVAKEMENKRASFINNISHEFRTPLNIILATIDLLNKNSKLEDVEWYTDKIQNNAMRLLKLSNNLIDLSQVGLEDEKIALFNYNIVDIVENTVLSVVSYANKKDIEVYFDTTKEEIIMACDKEKIERLLLNLLSNAVKFTPKGGKIGVTVDICKNQLEIQVEDSGIGIPKEQCTIIFERFVQVDTSLRRMCEGCGMGLAIAKEMVDFHGGTIWVNSEVGQGSTFIINLPIKENKQESTLNNWLSCKATFDQAKIEFSDIFFD